MNQEDVKKDYAVDVKVSGLPKSQLIELTGQLDMLCSTICNSMVEMINDAELLLGGEMLRPQMQKAKDEEKNWVNTVMRMQQRLGVKRHKSIIPAAVQALDTLANFLVNRQTDSNEKKKKDKKKTKDKKCDYKGCAYCQMKCQQASEQQRLAELTRLERQANGGEEDAAAAAERKRQQKLLMDKHKQNAADLKGLVDYTTDFCEVDLDEHRRKFIMDTEKATLDDTLPKEFSLIQEESTENIDDFDNFQFNSDKRAKQVIEANQRYNQEQELDPYRFGGPEEVMKRQNEPVPFIPKQNDQPKSTIADVMRNAALKRVKIQQKNQRNSVFNKSSNATPVQTYLNNGMFTGASQDEMSKTLGEFSRSTETADSKKRPQQDGKSNGNKSNSTNANRPQLSASINKFKKPKIMSNLNMEEIEKMNASQQSALSGRKRSNSAGHSHSPQPNQTHRVGETGQIERFCGCQAGHGYHLTTETCDRMGGGYLLQPKSYGIKNRNWKHKVRTNYKNTVLSRLQERQDIISNLHSTFASNFEETTKKPNKAPISRQKKKSQAWVGQELYHANQYIKDKNSGMRRSLNVVSIRKSLGVNLDEGSLRVHHKLCQNMGTFTKGTSQTRLLSGDPLYSPREHTHYSTIKQSPVHKLVEKSQAKQEQDLADYDQILPEL